MADDNQALLNNSTSNLSTTDSTANITVTDDKPIVEKPQYMKILEKYKYIESNIPIYGEDGIYWKIRP